VEQIINTLALDLKSCDSLKCAVKEETVIAWGPQLIKRQQRLFQCHICHVTQAAEKDDTITLSTAP